MFALKSVYGREICGAKDSIFWFSLSARHVVLPRLLRKPVRILSRFGRGGFSPPPYAASMLTFCFLTTSCLYGAYLGGHMPAMMRGVTAHSGFVVDQIKVSGNYEISEIDILDKLELDGWTSLISFNPESARERIVTLPWVRKAAVRKVYPNTIEVCVDERDAFAIWQHDNQLSVIEKDGTVIALYSGGSQAMLPLVVGIGAAKGASDFITKVRAYPQLATRVRGYIRVGERRWDLRLDNGVTVKLPETNVDAALKNLVAIDKRDAILTRDIAAIDMRFTDRLVVQLTPEAMERRQAQLKTKQKAVQATTGKKV